MPLDDSIPFRALAGMPRAETYDPLAVQEQINRNQVLQGAAQKTQRDAQAQQRLQQLAQQYGDDYDGLITAMSHEDPDYALKLAKGVYDARAAGADAHLKTVQAGRAALQDGLARIQGADETNWDQVTGDLIKEHPQLAPLFTGRPYSPAFKQQILGIGQSQDQWLKAQQDAAKDVLDGKNQLGLARLTVAADSPDKQRTLDELVQTGKFAGLRRMMPDAASAQIFIDKQAKQEADKSAKVGTFEDYVVRTYGPDPTPAQILAARKAYGQADDRAPKLSVSVAGGSLDTPAIKPGTALYRTAQDLAYGKLTFSQLRSLMSYNRNSGQKIALYDTARQLNPNFDAAKFEMGYKYASNPKTQNTLVSIDNALANFDKAMELSQQVGRTSIPQLNNILAKGKFFFGNKAVTNFEQFRTILGDDIALAIGQGAPSDYKTKLAQSLVDANLSDENFISTLRQSGEFLLNRKQAILRQEGPYGEGQSGGPLPKVMGGQGVNAQPAPDNVTSLLKSKGAGTYTLSDGSKWRKTPDGSVSKVQ